MWGLMSSGLKGFATRLWNGIGKMSALAMKAIVEVCAWDVVVERSSSVTSLLDACLLPIYIDQYNAL